MKPTRIYPRSTDTSQHSTAGPVAYAAHWTIREFEYGKGPTPPQHFGCRSTIVAVIDPDILPPSTIAKRASADGPVPINTSYGQWLKDQPLKTQQDVLGASKVPYFNRLVDKYGAKDAMAKLVRDDGSELTLEQLRKRYGPA
jgi:hypothetical protein